MELMENILAWSEEIACGMEYLSSKNVRRKILQYKYVLIEGGMQCNN